MYKEKNRVTIRVWHSAFNKVQQGENVGHVSIEIPSIKMDNPKFDEGNPDSQKKVPFYCSFWPGNPSAKSGIGVFFEKRDPHYMGGYESDQEAEKGGIRKDGKPETIICLYSLSVTKIYEKFEELKNTVDGWTLFGSNKLINQGCKQSCASFAYDVLCAGGIYDLAPSKKSLKFSSTATPDDMAAFVEKAKQRELKDYEETQKFEFEGETKIFPSKKSGCVML